MTPLISPILIILVAQETWPAGVDWWAIVLFFGFVVAAPALGYWFMLLDIRAYLRALRRALVCVSSLIRTAPTPDWARRYTPACLRSLGLELPCSEVDVKRAYRRLAEQLHPDRGGDAKRFLKLQQDFHAAMEFLDRQRPAGRE